MIYLDEINEITNSSPFFLDYSSSSITDNRLGSDQVDLRDDISSEQGGTGSASGSSLSASAYRGK